MSRGPRRAAAAAAALAVAAGAYLAVRARRTPPSRPAAERLAELKRLHAELHDRLETRLGGDHLLDEAVRDGGEVVVALRTRLVTDLLRAAAARYLDEVALDLEPEGLLQKTGAVKVLGGLHAGTWQLAVDIARLRGVLRARAPQVELGAGNRVHLAVPVAIVRGEGTATVHLKWDASAIANLLCRDFEVTRTIRGVILPDDYRIEGAFLLSADGNAITARPDFPETRFRVRVDLVGQSWEEVRRVFEEQDRFGRCGIGIDADELMLRLREVGDSGFDVRLPRKLLRTIQLPGRLQERVRVQDYELRLSVRPNSLRLTPETFWYSASVQTTVAAGPPRAEGANP